jgi:hypothetical protein
MVLASLAAAFLILLGPFGLPNANAIPVGITGYDILNADVSGTGAWSHTYSGTITPTTGSLANYSGGTGTMADGVLAGTDHTNTQYFTTQGANPQITLYLDGYYTISQIDFYGGDFGAVNNSTPGAIIGMDITLNASTQTFATTPFGPQNCCTLNLINDRVTITGSTLDGLVTNQIIISSVTSNRAGLFADDFSIAEIVIDGQRASVPEPSTLLLLGSGLVGLGFVRRRLKK